MARFQSHEGVRFHKKEDVIGDLEVPDDVLDLLFFVEVDTLVRSNLRHRFESNSLVLRFFFWVEEMILLRDTYMTLNTGCRK